MVRTEMMAVWARPGRRETLGVSQLVDDVLDELLAAWDELVAHDSQFEIWRRVMAAEFPDDGGLEITVALLRRSMERRDDREVESAWGMVLALGFDQHPLIVPMLVDLLYEPWHFLHQELCCFLGRSSSPEVVDGLFWAASVVPRAVEYNDGFAQKVEAIHSLYGMREDPSVRARLEWLSLSQNPEVAAGFWNFAKDPTFQEVRALQPSEGVVRWYVVGSSSVWGGPAWSSGSLLWMMHHSFWGQRPDCAPVFAVDLDREFFLALLGEAVPETCSYTTRLSEDEWFEEARRARVVSRWEPERDRAGAPRTFRALQLGFTGDPFVTLASGIVAQHELGDELLAWRAGEVELPVETPLPLPWDVDDRLGSTGPSYDPRG